MVCQVFIDAYRAGAITKGQEHIADKCQLLMGGFARVGIIALVDEATGYQAERDRDELEKILAFYVNPELLPWTRRFGQAFYQEAFRLHGWTYRPPQVKKPMMLAKFTDDTIYKQLPPGVRDELRRKNPPNEKGRRRFKNFQFLTADVGDPHLQSQKPLLRLSCAYRGARRSLIRCSAAHFRRITNPRYPA